MPNMEAAGIEPAQDSLHPPDPARELRAALYWLFRHAAVMRPSCYRALR